MDECWDINQMEKMTDDHLKFIRVIFVELYLNKYVRLCIVIGLIIHLPLWVVQFYYFLCPFNPHLVMMHGPSSLAFLYGLLSMVILLKIKKNLHHDILMTDRICWSPEVCSEGVKKEILQKSTFMFYVCIGNILLALVTYYFFLTRVDSGKPEIIYQIIFLREHFPEYASVLIRLFQASVLVLVAPMITVVYIIGYFVLHIVLQGRMLHEKIKKITEQHKGIESICDKAYQQQVHERLIFCIIRTQHLMRFCNISLGIVPPLIITYTILIMLLVVSYLGGYYLNREQYIPLLSSIIIVSCYTGMVGFEIGQITEDGNKDIYLEFIALPWYTFNLRNRKMFLFVLANFQKPITLSAYEKFPFNRTTVVKIYKVFSTVSTFLANTRERIA